MSPTSLQSERLFLSDPTDARLHRDAIRSDRFVAAITGPELIGIAIFCALGLLLTAVINLIVPNFGEIVVSLQPFL